jgi:hypothetical protein
LNNLNPQQGAALAPGTVVEIFGTNLTTGDPVKFHTVPLPKSLNGTSVTIGGIKAPVIWAAGVTASPFGQTLAKRAGARLDKTGRVLVNPDCSVPGHPDILVIGDLARFEERGQPLHGVAPAAMQEGSRCGAWLA